MRDLVNQIQFKKDLISVSTRKPRFQINSVSTQSTGVVFGFTITALTANGFPNSAYNGTVHFSSSDTTAVLHADTTLVNGKGTFSATLTTVGSQVLAARDTKNVFGSKSIIITTTPSYVIVAPSIVYANIQFTFTVTALNNVNQTDTSYRGAISFTPLKVPFSILSANASDNSISVLLGNGNGTFATQQTLACGTYPCSIAFADLTGDGVPDIIVANKYNQSVSVLLGNGDNTFQGTNAFSTGVGSEIYHIQAVDLNGDGKIDLACADYYGRGVVVLLGNGDGSFQLPTSFALPDQPYSLIVTDLNGDGKPDIVAQTFSHINVLMGNGNGTFQTSFTILATGASGVFVAAADINGDNKTDLFVTIPGVSPHVSMLLGNNDGTFQTPQTIATLPANANFIILGDITGDGKVDLITDYNAITLVMLGNGNGTFKAKQTFSEGGASWGQGVLADFNSDGKPDLARVNGGSFPQANLWLGNGNGTFGAGHTFAVGNKPLSIATGQLTPLSLPNNYTFTPTDNGKHVFSATLQTISTITITGTDSLASSITGKSGEITVDAPVTSFAIVGPSHVTSGIGFSFVVNAVGGAPSSFNGTVAFSSSDFVATLPGSSLTSGTGTFSATLSTIATNSLVVTNDSLIGQSSINTQAINFIFSGTSGLGILLGNGDGTFQAPITIAASDSFAVITGDINGDTKPDIIYTTFADTLVHSNAIVCFTALHIGLGVLIVNSNGTFQTIKTFAAGTAPSSVSTGDINGDKILDVALSNPSTNSISVLLGNGDGTFQTASSWAAGTGCQSVLITDLNFDGNFDLVACNRTANTISSLLGNGNGTFQGQTTYATIASPWVIITNVFGPSDFPDIIVGSKSGSVIGCLLGNGNGTFKAQVTYATGTGPQSICTTNLTNFNIRDLAVGNFVSNTISVLLGNNNGTFQGQHTFATGHGPIAIAAGDINGDGASKQDLVTANYTDNNVSVLLGNGNGTFQAQHTFACGTAPQSISLTDLNGDGKLDITVANYSTNVLTVLLGNGDGTFQAGSTFSATSPTALDIVSTILGSTHPIGIILSNGDGTLNPVTNVPFNLRSYSVNLADIDGDGKSDLVLANLSTDASVIRLKTVSTFLGNGNGTFKTPNTVGSYFNGIQVAVGDINGDGKNDLIGSYYANVNVMLGNGNGSFQNAIRRGINGYIYSFTITDIDGDGKKDIVGVDTNYNCIHILLGNGNGTFKTEVTFATGTAPRFAAVADLNGDGKPDIAVTNYNSNTVSVLLGNGNGTFQGQHTFATGVQPLFIKAADLNGDGKIDLAIINETSNTLSVLLGNGNGTFQIQHTFTTGANASGLDFITGVNIGTPQSLVFTTSAPWTAPLTVVSPITVELNGGGGGGGGPDRTPQSRVYSSAGNYVFSDFVGVVTLETWGAGAGGGGTDNSGNGAGAGGGGAYSKINAYTVSGPLAVHVGAGGAAGDNTGIDGIAGDGSGAGGINYAGGGSPGTSNLNGGLGGAGGVTSGGDTTVNGQQGADDSGGSGAGGGGCGNGQSQNTGQTGGVGANGGGNGGNSGANAGGAPGGGGGGAAAGGANGGPGADGQVKISWTPLEQVGSGGGGGAYKIGTLDVIGGHTYNIVVGTGGLGGGDHTRGADGNDSVMIGETITLTGQHGNGGLSGGSGGGVGGTGTHNGGSGTSLGGAGGGADSGGNGGNGAGTSGGAGGSPGGGVGGNSTQDGAGLGGGGGGGNPGGKGGKGARGRVKITFNS